MSRRRGRLIWRLYPTYLIVIVACAAFITVYAERSTHSFYLRQTQKDLESRAWLVEQELHQPGALSDLPLLQNKVRELGRSSDTRITVIAPDGVVLADSENDPAAMENHRDRPEIQTALHGEVGESIRVSPTEGRQEMYVGVPLTQGSRVTAVVRTALPLTDVNTALSSLYERIVLAAVLASALAALIGLYVSRRLSRPLVEMRRGADRFAAGDLGHKLPVPETEELGGLAEALNSMAAELDEKLRTITRQTNELEAILASMVEGVVAVDRDERVITVNAAAARLLGIDPEQARGATIQEVVRNPDLQSLITSAAAGERAVERELVLHGGQQRVLQTHATVLLGAKGGVRGVLVVLNDVTRLKRLETVRREFVANVSHELRTPVTSIKGFAETLVDGALDDREDAERFVRIIASQADRLSTILEDLLALSRLEQEEGRAPLGLEPARVADVLEAAREVCAARAREKSIDVELACPPDLRAPMSSPLMEQAVINLIDNAIKYSEEASRVEVNARSDDRRVLIEVRDEGLGIERRHLPRLFERFYRIDRARSRELGGTGLGLAIVKHIAQVHGGDVSVDSEPGKGSTFTISLPAG